MNNARRPVGFVTLLACVLASAGVLFTGRHSAAEPVRPNATPVTFAKDIATIVYGNCVSCHHDGGGAPFSLMTYEQAKKKAAMLAHVTESRQMPPWKAEAGYGTFANERHLTDAQIALFRQWADGGAPAGDLADAPKPPTFESDNQWTLGKPDLVVKVGRTFTLPAAGPDVYRCFVVPLELKQDQYVSAVEFRPSNRTVVHHALLYLDRSGAARKLESDFHAAHPDDGQPGYPHFGGPGFTPTGGLGGWAPGALPSFLPADVARPLAAGSDLIIQTHLHPSGKAETEQSEVAIYFAKTPPKYTLMPVVIGSRKIDIQPGEKDYVVTAQRTVPVDVSLVGITPHAHLICRDMDVWADVPGRTEKLPLIRIKDWDFNWQGTYRYASPVRLPAGSTVHMRYVYDNSADNERNPNTPPQRVTYGEQTNDEMAFCFFEGYTDKPIDGLRLKLSQLRGLRGGNAIAPPATKPAQ